MDGEFEDDDNVEIMTIEVPEDDITATPPQEPRNPPEEPLEPEPLRTRPVPQDTPRSTAGRPPRGADVLRQQLESTTSLVDSLQTANTRAQTELQRQRQENAELRRSQVEEKRNILDGNIKSIDAALDEAEANLAKAFEAGVGADVAKAQRRLSELTAQRQGIASQLTSLPSQDELKQQTEQAVAPRTQEERIETYIAQFSPQSQAWLRRHQDFITDRGKNQRLLNAHKVAVEKENLEPDTPEYFQYLDSRLGLSGDQPAPRPRAINGGDQGDDHMNAGPQPMKRASTPVRPSAPVRGGNGLSVTGMRSVKLTQGEITHATDGTIRWDRDDPKGRWRKDDPIGVNEMARRKAAIQSGKAGKLRYMTGEDA